LAWPGQPQWPAAGDDKSAPLTYEPMSVANSRGLHSACSRAMPYRRALDCTTRPLLLPVFLLHHLHARSAGKIHRRQAAPIRFLSQLEPPRPCSPFGPSRGSPLGQNRPRLPFPLSWSAITAESSSPCPGRSGASLSLFLLDLASP
jgi:hypothetical protein